MSEPEYDEIHNEPSGDPALEATPPASPELENPFSPRWTAPARSSRLLRATLIVSLVYLGILLLLFLTLRAQGVFA